MCGIFGAISKRSPVAPLLAEGLERLEYRGYDSAGFATVDGDGRVHVVKDVGPVEKISPLGKTLPGFVGIAHTRWATHGGVTKENAHPHLDCQGKVAVVHNGILDNYLDLRRELIQRGHRFSSATDSEVLAHLVEEGIREGESFEESFRRAIGRVRGQLAVACIFSGCPGVLAVARNGAPLAIGVTKEATFVASDALPFLPHTREAVFLEDGEMAFLSPGAFRLEDREGKKIERPPTALGFDFESAKKGPFPHFTRKEIEEIPEAISRASSIDDETLRDAALEILRAREVVITASGSSRYASLVGRALLAAHADTYADVVLAAEFAPLARALSRGSLVVAVSQSGETLDVLEGCKEAKERGARILALVNVPGSSLARMADFVLPLRAGPEVAVAATKSFANQIVVFSLLAHAAGGKIAQARKGIAQAQEAVRTLLRRESGNIRRIAGWLSGCHDIYLVARGVHFPVASEGALKLKELAYLHAEGMPAGEFKHGTLALIEPGVPVVAITGTGENRDHLLATVEEVKARGARVVGVSTEPWEGFDEFIELAPLEEDFQPLVEAAALQLLAYEVAVARGLNPDRPRNLAKSVTVK